MSMQIEMVDVDKLTGASFNPKRRTQAGSMVDLLASMRRDGFWPYAPILVGRDGVIADGHRRLAAAKILGIAQVPVIYTDKSSDELFTAYNSTRRNLGANDMLYSFAAGNKFADKYSAVFERILAAGGNELLQEMAEAGTSPALFYACEKFARENLAGNLPPFVAKMTRWAVKHKMHFVILKARMLGIEPDAIYQAVMEDKPIVYGVQK